MLNDLTDDGKIRLWELFGSRLTEEFTCAADFMNNCEKTYGRPTCYPACLPVPAFNSATLDKSMKLLLCTEENRERKCPQPLCKSDIAGSKTVLDKLPKVLIIQLQRFFIQDNQPIKLKHMINIPKTFHPFIGSPKYTLTGAMVHCSEVTSNGHYLALIRCPTSGHVFICNDDALPKLVTANSKEENLLDTAYMLIYSIEQETKEALQLHSNRKNLKVSAPENSTIQNNQSMQAKALNETIPQSIPDSMSDQIQSPLHKKMKIQPKSVSTVGTSSCSNFYDPEVSPKIDIKKATINHTNTRKGESPKPSLFTKEAEEDSTEMGSLPSPSYMSIFDKYRTPDMLSRIESGKDSTEEDCLHSPSYVPIYPRTKIVSSMDVTEDSLPTTSKMADAESTLSRIESGKDSTEEDSLPSPSYVPIYPRANIVSSMDVTEDSLPTTSMMQDAKSHLESSPHLLRLTFKDIKEMTRDQLLSYINSTIGDKSSLSEQNTAQLRKSVLNVMLDNKLKDVTTSEARNILAMFNIVPQNSLNRILKQIKSLAKVNKDTQNILEKLLQQKDAATIMTPEENNNWEENISKLTPSELKNILISFQVKPQNGLKRLFTQLKKLLKNNIACQQMTKEILRNKRPNEETGTISSQVIYENDFYPANISEIEVNKMNLRKIREWRLENLISGQFFFKSDILSCPIHVAGVEMHEELNRITLRQCKTCLEEWPDLEVGPKNGKCKRCAQERLPPEIPPTFSPENNMHPGQQPECLKILNTVETAAISLICPQMSIYKLKYGSTGLKGHSISFYQNIQEFVNILPRRPECLPIIVIKAPNQKVPLSANRFHILSALQFLIRYNPDYKNIKIDMNNISSYPDNSQSEVENIRILDVEPENVPRKDHVTSGDGNSDNHADLDDSDLVETVAPTEVPTLPISDQIRLGIGVTEVPTDPQVIKWPTREIQPASEWEPGFFSKSFPNLFPYGTGDITKSRVGKRPEFLQYIRHLTRLKNNSFAADQRFILHVINMYRRHKALTLGKTFQIDIILILF